ncbi:Protein kinase-like protein [Gracilaria domingensis]|nr:Protein kinase-like protein [Gracilaria domingensis]KAI0556879.1 Protein kinase-like protein [Gracilaria domingensis]
MNCEGNVVNQRWTVGPKIYQSDVSCVYKAHDSMIFEHQPVIKFAVPYGLEDLEQGYYSSRLADSFYTMQSLKAEDPEIKVPNVWETGIHEGLRYVVMERLHCTLYQHLIWSNNFFSTSTVLKVSIKVFENLIRLHAQNCAHGDISEDHVMSSLSQTGISSELQLVGFTGARNITPQLRMNDVFKWLQMCIRLMANKPGYTNNCFRMTPVLNAELSNDQIFQINNIMAHAMILRNDVSVNAANALRTILNIITQHDIYESQFDYNTVLILLYSAYETQQSFDWSIGWGQTNR